MAVKDVNDQNFDADVLQSDKPVLIDFWASWCGPCKAMAPILDEVAAELDTVDIVKMNIDENPHTPTKYGVRGIPTFMVFKNGELQSTKVGGMSKEDMKNWLSSIA